MNPMHKCRSLCLRSTATRKGDLPALVSSRDTSPRARQGGGQHDKLPALPRRGTEYLRDRNVVCFWNAILPRPCMHFCMTHPEPDVALAGRSQPSLSVGGSPTPGRARCARCVPECLLTSRQSIAQMYKTRKRRTTSPLPRIRTAAFLLRHEWTGLPAAVLVKTG
jgi:hypothetical protein